MDCVVRLGGLGWWRVIVPQQCGMVFIISITWFSCPDSCCGLWCQLLTIVVFWPFSSHYDRSLLSLTSLPVLVLSVMEHVSGIFSWQLAYKCIFQHFHDFMFTRKWVNWISAIDLDDLLFGHLVWKHKCNCFCIVMAGSTDIRVLCV